MSKKFTKVIIISGIVFVLLLVTALAINNDMHKSTGQTLGEIGGTGLTVNRVSDSGISKSDMGSTSMSPGVPGIETYDKQDPTKVIKNSNITMQTDDYDNSLKNINSLIKNSEAMIVKMQETQGNNYYLNYADESKLKTVDIIVKVSKDKFENFNSEVKKYANVISYYEEAQDISSNYSDIEAKIASYKLQEIQLNELLKKATAAKDLLEISNQMQNVIQQREYLQRQKDSYDNQIEYSTVSIRMMEVKSIVIKEKNIFSRITDTFKSSLSQIKGIGITMIMIIVYVVPYLVILGIVTLVIYRIIKAKKKRK